jgi:periplasmic protein TonB
MSAYPHDTGFNQRRMAVLVAIVVLHLFIAWAFVNGFGKTMVAMITKDVKVSLIKEEQAKELPPPPPKPDLLPPPPVSVPPPLVNINIPVEAPPIVTTSKPPPPPAPHIATVASTPIQNVRMPDCGEDYYPSQAQRLQQTGSANVKFCVGPEGKIDPTSFEVTSSSGYPELDTAAGKCISAGKFKPGTVEGKPVRSCKTLKITFKLK